MNKQESVYGKMAILSVDIFKCDFYEKEREYDYLDVEGIPTMEGYQERIFSAAKVINKAREKDIPVIFIQEAHRKDGIDFGRELDGIETEHCLEGDDDVSLPFEALNITDRDYLVVKRRYSAFFATDLELLLKGLGVETLILVGGLTDVCIHYTFVDGHQNNYHCKVLEDCVGGSCSEAHEASLKAMEYLQSGSIISSEIFDKILANCK